MKRIQSACLSQTIHFKLKEDAPHDAAVNAVKSEWKAFKDHLDQSRTAYKIIDEQTQDDGSVIVKIKRQLNKYDVGDYLA
jgi:hypothetical protein